MEENPTRFTKLMGRMKQLDNLNLLSFIIKKDYESIENYLKRDYFDFKDFKNFVDKHQLSGNLYLALNDSYLKDFFSVDLIRHFKSFYMKQWMINEQIIKETERLAELFIDSREKVIFLKGHFLVQRFYGDIDRRPIRDIDILVKKEDIDSIDRLLTGNGFKRTSAILLNKNLTIYFTHHFEYWKQDIPLDLHWVLMNHFSFNLNYETIWKEKLKFIYKNKLFYVLSDEYELVFRILSILMDIQLGVIILKSLVDIYMILKAIDKSIVWDDFFANRKTEGLFCISLNILDLVLNIFNCHSDFIELYMYIEKNKKYIKYKDLNEKMNLLSHSWFAFKNKLWAFRLYQTSVFKSFCWWAISLPFRLAIHREWSLELLRR